MRKRNDGRGRAIYFTAARAKKSGRDGAPLKVRAECGSRPRVFVHRSERPTGARLDADRRDARNSEGIFSKPRFGGRRILDRPSGARVEEAVGFSNPFDAVYSVWIFNVLRLR